MLLVVNTWPRVIVTNITIVTLLSHILKVSLEVEVEVSVIRERVRGRRFQGLRSGVRGNISRFLECDGLIILQSKPYART